MYAWNKGITFKLAYCPTKLNVRADRASRAFASSAEWTLDAYPLVFYIDDTLIYGDSLMAVQQYVSTP